MRTSDSLIAQLNMASQRTAEAFGLTDVMTKTSVGMHKGQFGMFMEKVPGKEASHYGKDIQPEAPGRLSSRQIKELDDERYGKVVGEAPKPLPKVNGAEPNGNAFAGTVKKSVQTLQSSLFRRDFLVSIAKPGWFDGGGSSSSDAQNMV